MTSCKRLSTECLSEPGNSPAGLDHAVRSLRIEIAHVFPPRQWGSAVHETRLEPRYAQRYARFALCRPPRLARPA
jgi:hypothetical protein